MYGLFRAMYIQLVVRFAGPSAAPARPQRLSNSRGTEGAGLATGPYSVVQDELCVAV